MLVCGRAQQSLVDTSLRERESGIYLLWYLPSKRGPLGYNSLPLYPLLELLLEFRYEMGLMKHQKCTELCMSSLVRYLTLSALLVYNFVSVPTTRQIHHRPSPVRHCALSDIAPSQAPSSGAYVRKNSRRRATSPNSVESKTLSYQQSTLAAAACPYR